MSSAIPIQTGGDSTLPLHLPRDSFAHSQGMGGISWGNASVGSWLRDEVLMATRDHREMPDGSLNGDSHHDLTGSGATNGANHGSGLGSASGSGGSGTDPNGLGNRVSNGFHGAHMSGQPNSSANYVPSLPHNFPVSKPGLSNGSELRNTGGAEVNGISNGMAGTGERGIGNNGGDSHAVDSVLGDLGLGADLDVDLPLDLGIDLHNDLHRDMNGDLHLHGDLTSDNLGRSTNLGPAEHAYFPSMEANFCRDYSCCGNILPTLHDLLRHYEEQHISPSPPDEPPVMRRVQNIESVSTNDVFLPFDPPRPMNGHANDLGMVGMDLDGLDLGLDTDPNAPPAFAPPSFQPLSQSMLAQGVNKPAHNPADMNAYHNMARVNNMAGLNPGMHGMPVPNGMNHNASVAALLGDDEEPTIDDPARQLYMLERTEHKPFKCPVIGCEKTYKNQNGLKYHRQHGHQNQTLHQNDDGTFSIIDPLSNTPYPDGMGMEKDKPYRCEICGKRYKNLNGLKYHRAHTTH